MHLSFLNDTIEMLYVVIYLIYLPTIVTYDYKTLQGKQKIIVLVIGLVPKTPWINL